MAQVYAIVHDAAQCLVFKKNKKATYFQYLLHPPTPDPFAFYVSGCNLTRHNGGGKYCFPGGNLDRLETPLAGAIREFHEETGFDLRTVPYTTPTPIHTVTTTNYEYHAVFFDVGAAPNLTTIFNACVINLNAKNTAKNLFNPGTTSAQARGILTTAQVNIEDDEQELCSMEDLTIAGDKIDGNITPGIFDKNIAATDWFYEICCWAAAQTPQFTFVT